MKTVAPKEEPFAWTPPPQQNWDFLERLTQLIKIRLLTETTSLYKTAPKVPPRKYCHALYMRKYERYICTDSFCMTNSQWINRSVWASCKVGVIFDPYEPNLNSRSGFGTEPKPGHRVNMPSFVERHSIFATCFAVRCNSSTSTSFNCKFKAWKHEIKYVTKFYRFN
jgi:hypothetical protein